MSATTADAPAGSKYFPWSYVELFSAGAAGWIGGCELGHYAPSDSPYYAWDPKMQALFVKQPNKNFDGQDHFYCRKIEYQGGSFTLRFDLYIKVQAHDGKLAFGLSSKPEHAWDPHQDRSHWYVGYGRNDAGGSMYMSGICRDWAWSAGRPRYEGEGKWLRHEFAYDEEFSRVHVRIVESGGNDKPVVLDETKVREDGFLPEMSHLVLSDNRCHRYPTTINRIPGTGFLDNIYFANSVISHSDEASATRTQP